MRRDAVSRTGLWTEVDDSVVQAKPSERTQMWSDTCHKRLASPRRRDGLPVNATTQRASPLSRCSTRAFTPRRFLWPLARRTLRRSGINAWPVGRICCMYTRGLPPSQCAPETPIMWRQISHNSLFTVILTCQLYQKLLNTDGGGGGVCASGEIRRDAIMSNLI